MRALHTRTEKQVFGHEPHLEDPYDFVHGCDVFKCGLPLASDWFCLCIRIALIEMFYLKVSLSQPELVITDENTSYANLFLTMGLLFTK